MASELWIATTRVNAGASAPASQAVQPSRRSSRPNSTTATAPNSAVSAFRVQAGAPASTAAAISTIGFPGARDAWERPVRAISQPVHATRHGSESAP